MMMAITATTAATVRLDADWLREGELARILALLDCDGEEARVVGGAVRNALLGLPHGDIDIATNFPASPSAVPRVSIVSLAAANISSAYSTDRGATFTLSQARWVMPRWSQRMPFASPVEPEV